MKIIFTKNYTKKFTKLPSKIQTKALERLALFRDNPTHSQLNNHPLIASYEGYRSINVTGDVRAIYKQINHDTIAFIAIGSHSELYS